LAGISQDSEAIRILEKYNRHVDPYGVVDSITHMTISQEHTIVTTSGLKLHNVLDNFYSIYGDHYFIYENDDKKNYSRDSGAPELKDYAKGEFLIKFNLNMVNLDHEQLQFQLGVKNDSTISVIQITDYRNTTVYWFEADTYNLVKVESIYSDQDTKIKRKRITRYYNYYRLSNGILVPTYVTYKSEVIEARIDYLDYSFDPF